MARRDTTYAFEVAIHVALVEETGLGGNDRCRYALLQQRLRLLNAQVRNVTIGRHADLAPEYGSKAEQREIGNGSELAQGNRLDEVLFHEEQRFGNRR